MNRSTIPFRIVGLIGVVALLALMLAGPAGASSLRQDQPPPDPGTRPPPPVAPSPTNTPSPTVTPSATPVPYIELDPTRTGAEQKIKVDVFGYNWPIGGPPITLYWDQIQPGNRLGDSFGADGNGQFKRTVTVPEEWTAQGMHRIHACNEAGLCAVANIELVPSTEAPPSDTPEPSATFTPSPTLRPVTPMVTITPIPPTKAPARPPATAKPPAPTRTATPKPGTDTPTPTPSITPTASDTPGPGTPSATPEPTSTPTLTPTAVEEISDTGAGWGTIFLWGFVLAGLLVVFRLLRVRSLKEPS